MGSPAQTTRLHPPVCPKVECEFPPMLPHPLIPRGTEGFLTIDGTPYALAYVTDRRGEELVILGYQFHKGDFTTYALPADLSSCECLDRLTRDREDGLCKHGKAILQLRADGHLI